MTITRVTQGMMMDRSYLSLQTGLSRLAKTQEHLSTGRVLNRPSDSPTDTTSAMRLRASLSFHGLSFPGIKPLQDRPTVLSS